MNVVFIFSWGGSEGNVASFIIKQMKRKENPKIENVCLFLRATLPILKALLNIMSNPRLARHKLPTSDSCGVCSTIEMRKLILQII